MPARQLTSMFYPKSVAIVGASRKKKKLGHIIMANILAAGYKGDVYPINPKAKQLFKHKVYPDLLSLPKTPDLVVISIPARFVVSTLEQAGQIGVKQVVIITAGFEEMGEEGAALVEQMMQAVKQYQINILGPNCLGYVNNSHNINVSFGQVVNNDGSLRFISQSGAIASGIFDFAESAGMGFDQFVTLGNKTQITENDILEFWRHQDPANHKHDPEQDIKKGLSGYRPVGMYLESITDGENFVKLARQITQNDPLFILKPGKSDSAQKAMQSHTGSIAGADAVLDQAFKDAGVIRCEGAEDLFDLCHAFAWEQAPKGDQVAVVSNAGGPAVVTADAVELSGLKLAKITEKAEQQMAELLPEAAALHNPVDVLGDALADRYEVAMRAVLESRDVHAMLVILTPQVMTEIEETARRIVKMSQEYGKPIVTSFIGGSHIAAGEKILNQFKIPSFRYPERAVRALSLMHWWRSNFYKKRTRKVQSYKPAWAQNHPAIGIKARRIETIINDAIQSGDPSVPSTESNHLLEQWGIKVPPLRNIENYTEARAFAQKNSYPVVLKISSSKLLHKVDQGGVILNIQTDAELNKSVKKLQSKVSLMRAHGDDTAIIQIQKMVPDGVEVIVGIKRDISFGPVMMFGAGGTLAELISDTNLALLPMDQQSAEALVTQSKIYKLLRGYRGQRGGANRQLYQIMSRLTGLAEMYPLIEEIEINPVIVTPDAAWAVDGKVLVQTAD